MIRQANYFCSVGKKSVASRPRRSHHETDMRSPENRPTGAAFLLSQIGALARERFGEKTATLGITPAHAGILRLLGNSPGTNQQELAATLGVLPSRMVLLLDELGEKGLVERGRSTEDRRQSILELTRAGKQTLKRLSKLAAEHENELCRALNLEERRTLAALCRTIAADQGLAPNVHPGYRRL